MAHLTERFVLTHPYFYQQYPEVATVYYACLCNNITSWKLLNTFQETDSTLITDVHRNFEKSMTISPFYKWGNWMLNCRSQIVICGRDEIWAEACSTLPTTPWWVLKESVTWIGPNIMEKKVLRIPCPNVLNDMTSENRCPGRHSCPRGVPGNVLRQ